MNHDLRIGYFTGQPSSIDPFHGFDPDSYTAITACHDSLTSIGLNGELIPGLAKEWTRVDPLTIEFTLREGVEFHNGEKLTSEAVVATIAAQRNPENRSPTGQGLLSSINRAEAIDNYRFRIITEYPDSMLLWRLAIFSDIVPPIALADHGVDGFKDHPIGTGPFIFDSMEKGKYIRYVKNPKYWRGVPTVDSFRFVIMPAPNWVEALIENKLDLVYGLHSVQEPLLENRSDILIKKRLVALSHWFLLSENGPLTDKRVRQALNYAIDNYMLAKIHGQSASVPQRSIATEGQYGYNDSVPMYPFSIDKAKELMAEAGYSDGFTLRGIVADHSVSLVQMISAYLADINVKLDYEVVPRAVWMDRIPNSRMGEAGRYQGDFAVSPIDNPIMYSGFHHYILLSSGGPFSLLNNSDYDQKFLKAMTSLESGEKELQELDQYVHDEAMLLFTIQSSVIVAARFGIDLAITQSGHFGNYNWCSLKDARKPEDRPEWQHDFQESELPISASEFYKVLEATQYSSDLFYFPEHNLNDSRLEKMVTNLNYQQKIKQLQDKFRFSQIVQYINKTRDMEGILDASRFSGIANYNRLGKLVLCNDSFTELFGDEVKDRSLSELFTSNDEWKKFQFNVETKDGLFGSLNLKRSDNQILEAQVACTLRRGTAGENIGYLLIVRDESEERKLRRELEASYADLEKKVELRTQELQNTLAEVQQLKQIQDGDYYLTTLLLEPLSFNTVTSNTVLVDTVAYQKKKFSFKNKALEIGGDVNIATSIELRGKSYALIVNGDAMGKSIQGAGGVLVFGSILRAMIERSRMSPMERQFYPERWLRNTINEIQLVFESFNGSMLVSAVMALIEEDTGTMFYVNAEHPSPVLLRGGRARFFSQKGLCRKIGSPGLFSKASIRVIRLESDDQLFLGSDGKDDLVISEGEDRIINEDETLFLRFVEVADGDIDKIIAQIEEVGEVMDDLSILKVRYQPAEVSQRLSLHEARLNLKNQMAQKGLTDDHLMALVDSHTAQYPEDSSAIEVLGKLYRRTQCYTAAIDTFERLRLRHGKSLKTLQALVDLYAFTGKSDRANQILNECLEIDPDNAVTLTLKSKLESRVH